MVVIDASLNDFNIKVKNNLEIAYTHMEKVYDIACNINVEGNGLEYDKLRDILCDCEKIKNDIKDLEDWAASVSVKTQDILDNMLNDAYKLPSFYITERDRLSK